MGVNFWEFKNVERIEVAEFIKLAQGSFEIWKFLTLHGSGPTHSQLGWAACAEVSHWLALSTLPEGERQVRQGTKGEQICLALTGL